VAGAMKEATDRQLEVLEYMRTYQRTNGMPPTVREIADAFGVASTNAIMCTLRALERKGLVFHRPMISRGWMPKSPIETGEVSL
jgi:repressor LexA